MIDFETARRLVSERLARMERDMHDFGAALPDHENEPRLHLVVVKTTEYDFGWVFAYDSKEYLETNDIGFAVAGNAPFIVDKNDGGLYITGTAGPVEDYVKQYRRGVRNRA